MGFPSLEILKPMSVLGSLLGWQGAKQGRLFYWIISSGPFQLLQFCDAKSKSNLSNPDNCSTSTEGEQRESKKTDLKDWVYWLQNSQSRQAYIKLDPSFCHCQILQELSLLPSNKYTLWRNHLVMSHSPSIFVNTYINNVPRRQIYIFSPQLAIGSRI